jgi:hypothetical protein
LMVGRGWVLMGLLLIELPVYLATSRRQTDLPRNLLA